MNKFLGHILVVDDDDGIRKLVKQLLIRENFLVTTSGSAENAINKIEYIPYFFQRLDNLSFLKSSSICRKMSLIIIYRYYVQFGGAYYKYDLMRENFCF